MTAIAVAKAHPAMSDRRERLPRDRAMVGRLATLSATTGPPSDAEREEIARELIRAQAI
jgi:hypothetical protein